MPYLNIQNYNAYHSTRNDGNGGCALFVHDSLTSNLIEKKSEFNIEFLTVKILNLGIHILVMYKQPPVNGGLFIDALQERIENKKNIIIVGDTNLNLLNESNVNKNYVSMLTANSCNILNKTDPRQATRVATRMHGDAAITTSTRIDHFITDCVGFSFVHSQTDSPLSDHKQALLSFDNKKHDNFISIKNNHSFIKLNKAKYFSDLHAAISNPVNITSSERLVTNIENCKNNKLTQKFFTSKSNPTKPWINEHILSLIKERDRYHILRKKSPSNAYLEQKYKDLCAHNKSERYKLCSNYNSNAINSSLNNPKQMRKNLNNIIYNKTQGKSTTKALSTEDNSIITNPKQIANTFNTFFCNVGKSLHDNLAANSGNTLPVSNINSIDSTMYLWDVRESEILHKIRTMKKMNR